jgi:integrase
LLNRGSDAQQPGGITVQHLTIPELKSLLHNIKKPHHRLMVLVTFHHGLRVSETLGLMGQDIRGGMIAVDRLKGSERTIQPYVVMDDPDLDESAALSALAAKVKAQEYLFKKMSPSGFLKLMQRAGKKAGISQGARYQNKLHPHALKHSLAMALVPHMPLNELQKYLGHKSLASTGQYTKVSDEIASASAHAVLQRTAQTYAMSMGAGA